MARRRRPARDPAPVLPGWRVTYGFLKEKLAQVPRLLRGIVTDLLRLLTRPAPEEAVTNLAEAIENATTAVPDAATAAAATNLAEVIENAATAIPDAAPAAAATNLAEVSKNAATAVPDAVPAAAATNLVEASKNAATAVPDAATAAAATNLAEATKNAATAVPDAATAVPDAATGVNYAGEACATDPDAATALSYAGEAGPYTATGVNSRVAASRTKIKELQQEGAVLLQASSSKVKATPSHPLQPKSFVEVPIDSNKLRYTSPTQFAIKDWDYIVKAIVAIREILITFFWQGDLGDSYNLDMLFAEEATEEDPVRRAHRTYSIEAANCRKGYMLCLICHLEGRVRDRFVKDENDQVKTHCSKKHRTSGILCEKSGLLFRRFKGMPFSWKPNKPGSLILQAKVLQKGQHESLHMEYNNQYVEAIGLFMRLGS
ncbi:hypothetical protein U9M48_027285 [Paspalum notatum var. saurae]|uniref:Uncharacterized protein n=1 Tax=Paspalum notatum var. saurae TaxID=547442 RepID=A0AAQ3TU47_PASNO